MMKRRPPNVPSAETDERPADPDATFVMMRAEDRSKWMSISYLLDKYRALLWLAGLVLIAAGFGFRTPKQQFDELIVLRANSDIALNKRIDSISTRLAAVEDLAVSVAAMVRIRCAEASPEVLRVAGIDCNQWLNNNPPRKRND